MGVLFAVLGWLVGSGLILILTSAALREAR
jgi:hypothetical protein